MRNSEYNMIIRVTDMDLKDVFLLKAKELGLTISNDNETKTGIEHIELGHAISVGTSDKFHINWARNIDYYANRQIVPVYDIHFDWPKIISRLNDYAFQQKKDKFFEVGDYKISSSNGDISIYNKDEDLLVLLSSEEVEDILDYINR